MAVKRPDNLVSFGCLHPILISNSHGEQITVPCRRCAYCRMHAAQILSNLGSLEALNTPILFVTLTYSNEYVPKINYSISDAEMIKDEDFPRYKLSLFTDDGEITDELITNQYTVDHVKKVSTFYSKRFPKFFRENQIPVLKISHVRDFIKRLNSRCYRKFKERQNFRVLYCGEYGPKTNRPHYHILFYCKSDLVRCFLYRACYSSSFGQYAWPYGRTDAKYYTGHGASYLTEYVQGLSTLSDVYCRSTYKSFCRHSRYFGLRPIIDLFKAAGGVASSKFNEYHFQIDGKDKLFHLPHNFENTVFPRCRDFVRLSTTEQCKRYTFAYRYFKDYPKWQLNSPSILADFIIQQVKDFRDFYGYQNVDIHSHTNMYWDIPYYFKVFGYHLIDYNLDKLRSRIYNDCIISFKFLRSYENLPCDMYYSFLDFVNIINRYYKNKDTFFQKMDAESLATLISIDDDTATDYFYNDRQISTDVTDYRSSPSFAAWTKYNIARFYDKSKAKKLKDPFTNKSYNYVKTKSIRS